MGIDNSPQFTSRNGYIYLYSQTTKCWYEIRKTDILPFDVIDQVKEIQEKALELAGIINK